jgi:hypothetical protein
MEKETGRISTQQTVQPSITTNPSVPLLETVAKYLLIGVTISIIQVVGHIICDQYKHLVYGPQMAEDFKIKQQTAVTQNEIAHAQRLESITTYNKGIMDLYVFSSEEEHKWCSIAENNQNDQHAQKMCDTFRQHVITLAKQLAPSGVDD